MKIQFQPKLLSTLKTYNKEQFYADLMSGVIVGIVALPLAIAFGIASGVTPEKVYSQPSLRVLSFLFWEVAKFRSGALPVPLSLLFMALCRNLALPD